MLKAISLTPVRPPPSPDRSKESEAGVTVGGGRGAGSQDPWPGPLSAEPKAEARGWWLGTPSTGPGAWCGASSGGVGLAAGTQCAGLGAEPYIKSGSAAAPPGPLVPVPMSDSLRAIPPIGEKEVCLIPRFLYS